ncbi:hypothetical protein [Spirilliplanes yamanashiensis]|uniref:Uncharacterized protein n=1 Tax=Spirilliplanes yamanashiensis TaxID=42233 RepID=A0A8J4DK42_9ACTN|nr:hypothetical protein [Spirilliplanes yamanashiensis]MDP9815405.1 hypothetical protein [Spirilliplanes yamanashiensis]GIJ03660.1 hypothetical protein Sya03_30120 [Spirilliplanes yamanashiensis]
MTSSRTTAAALLIAGAALLGGCAGTTSSDSGAPAPTPSGVPTGPPPPASADPLPPGSIPSGIPKTPTDIVRTAGWINGTVTRGGSGPCYGITDWDGVQFAVYSDAGVELAEGARVRAQVTPATLRISCGEGTPVEASEIDVLP